MAWRGAQTPAGAIAGAAAGIAACVGAGGALARVLGAPRSLAGDAALGLAGLLLLATGLGQLGWLSREAQLGLAAVGLACCALPTGAGLAGASGASRSRLAAGLALLGGALPIGLEAFDLAPVLGDATNHALAVARLWQTGDTAGLPSQLGGQLAGESLFALAGGLANVGLFDAGVAAALLIWLLAEATAPHREERSIPRRDRGDAARRDEPAAAGLSSAQRLALLALLALPIAVHPDIAAAPTARWSATLLHIAALLRLRRAIEASSTGADDDASASPPPAPRVDGGVLVLAAALVALRLELALLATSLVAGALLLPRPAADQRRHRFAALALWCVALAALQLTLRPAGAAALATAATFLVLPLAALLTAVILPLFGFVPWRDELSVACAGATAISLLGASGAAGSIQQAVFAAWFGLLVLALLRSFLPAPITAPVPAPPSRLAQLRGPMGLVLAISTGILVLGPNLHEGRRTRLVERVNRTLGAAAELRALGLTRLGDSGIGELQARTPAGAPLGFWGSHPGGLDFRRNPVEDLSWPRSRASAATFLAPLSRASLDEVDFVIVESVKKWMAGGIDPWGGAETGATGPVENVLELLAEARSARLYRVRK